ncbi:MAG: hypothetical protein ABIU54_04320 [Candidatus Eisenbacteria bacterium]
MQAIGFVHRVVLVVGLAAIIAAPASAQRCASGAADDPNARGPRTAVSAAVTTAPKPGLVAPSKSAPARPTAPSREEHHRSTQAIKNTHPVPRVKAAAPHEPANPGMGSLLRWTTGTGRDMSFLFDDDDTQHRADHILAGRAPPRAGPHTDLSAPANTPVASTLWMREAPGPTRGPTPSLTLNASHPHGPG